MTTPSRLDYTSRDPEVLARVFEHWGSVEVPQLDAPLYQALACSVARDRDLLAMAGRAAVGQPAPNLLLAAVHYLLLRGVSHPLARHYPTLGGTAPPDGAVALFRQFCLEHRADIEALVSTRLTQTNVIQRCSFLLPAFAQVWKAGEGRPLAQIEIGPSAGLNLQWSQFHYEYRPECEGDAIHWGDPDSRVRVECEMRGTRLPRLPAEIPVACRLGIDMRPVALSDDDAIDWLRALVWPEHVGRHERLAAAIDVARRDPPPMQAANAAEALPEALASAPADATLCVYGTHTLYQFSSDDLRAVFAAFKAEAASRPVFFVSCESTGERWSELKLATYRGADRTLETLARCNPHGRWIEWGAGDGIA